MRVFSDDLEDEFEADVDDDGNIALIEDDDDDDEFDEDDYDAGDIDADEMDEYVLPVIVEAILDGRIPSDDIEFAHATQIGLELGVVVETQNGLALSRDLEQGGLALSAYAKGFDKIRGFGKSLHATGMRGGMKRRVARTMGRAKSGMREAGNRFAATDFGNRTIGRLNQAGATISAKTKMAKRAAFRNRGKIGLGAGAVAGGAAMSSRRNPLTADAERRSKK